MDNLFKNLSLDNSVVYGLLAVFLALYGPRLHPKLPESVRNMFNNNYFRFAVILLITFLSTNNLQAALLITISFCLILSYTNSQEVEAAVEEHFRENYSNFDTIREFYDDEEDFGNSALRVAEESREDFKSPEAIMDSAQASFEKGIPDSKEDFKEKEGFNNYEHFEDDNEKEEEETEEETEEVPSACQSNHKSKECLELCYGSAGNGNKWCERVHPNPQKVLVLRKNNQQTNAPQNSTENKNAEEFTNIPGLEQLDKLTKNIVNQVKKYKNLIL